MKSGPEVNRPRKDQGQEVHGETFSEVAFSCIFLTFSALQLSFARKWQAARNTSTTVSSVHSLCAAFVRISNRMRCLHIPYFLNQYAAFNARKL